MHITWRVPSRKAHFVTHNFILEAIPWIFLSFKFYSSDILEVFFWGYLKDNKEFNKDIFALLFCGDVP